MRNLDDLTKLGSQLPDVASLGEQIMKSMQEYGKLHGIPIFEANDGSAGGGNSAAMQGAIRGVSEENASILVGQSNAIRIYQAQMAFDVRSSLLYLSNIEVNTRRLSKLNRLDDVVDRLERLNATSVRGFGLWAVIANNRSCYAGSILQSCPVRQT